MENIYLYILSVILVFWIIAILLIGTDSRWDWKKKIRYRVFWHLHGIHKNLGFASSDEEFTEFYDWYHQNDDFFY